MSESARAGAGPAQQQEQAAGQAQPAREAQTASGVMGRQQEPTGPRPTEEAAPRSARQRAGVVAGQAREQSVAMARDLRGHVGEEADRQARRTAGSLREWADELSDLAERAATDSPARTLVTQAAHGGHRAADYLDERGLGGLAADLEGFARRRPAAFLGGAMLAGFAVGRMAKAGRSADGSAVRSSADRTDSPGSATSPTGTTGTPDAAGAAGRYGDSTEV
jgi:hypothetical protein